MNTAVATRDAKPGVSYSTVPMDRSGAGGNLAPETLGEVVAFAEVMARADLALPKHLRGNAGACLAVAMQAMRWEMDPFAVANKSYSVNDRLAYEAQLVAAVVHTRAPIKGRPDYTFSGEGPTRRCKVTCEMADGSVREYESPTFVSITTKNSPLWKSDPDQQLGYFSIRSWARRHTPEVILGVYTPDEASQFRDVTPQKAGIMARLQEHGAGEAGFSADHVDTQINRPLAPEDVDAILEGDTLPEHDAETGEIIEAEPQSEAAREPEVANNASGGGEPVSISSTAKEAGKIDTGEDLFPGDRPAGFTSETPAPDPEDWAIGINGTLEACRSEAEIDAMLADPANLASFRALEKAKPAMAKALNAAITGKRKALSSMGRQA